MPKLTITINATPLAVYQKNDIWRGGMVAFGRAGRGADNDSQRGLIKTAEVSGYYQSQYLLEDQTLLTSWSSEKPETVAEIVGPAPSLAWAKGTITTTTGNKHELEYKLIPHTKEQAEKVFRERLIDQAAARHATTDAMADQLRELKNEKPTPETKPAPDNVFRRMGDRGDFWQIVFVGHKLPPVRHLAGMTYLHALLARPGHTFAVLDLYEIENPPPPEAVVPSKSRPLGIEERARYGTGGTRDCVMDAKMRQDILKRKAELETEIGDPDLDLTGREEREDEIERLETALAANRGAAESSGTTFENAETRRPRQAVSKAIDKALDALHQSPALQTHLRSAVRKGASLLYSAGLHWAT